MKRVLGIILGGGAGTRLYPLTKMRAKPAVPLAGKYRLIDIPVSNCINSGINKIYVLTQFNSASLNRHIAQTFNLSSGFDQGFVEVLAAQQTPESPSWFEGTADAVRKYEWLLQEWDIDEVLILSGDQLYRMDYAHFVDQHRSSGADLTVAALPVDREQAQSFGLMHTDSEASITKFREKPKGDALDEMSCDTASMGLSAEEAQRRPFLASMGIYVFKRDVLFRLWPKTLVPPTSAKKSSPKPLRMDSSSAPISSTITGKTSVPFVPSMSQPGADDPATPSFLFLRQAIPHLPAPLPATLQASGCAGHRLHCW